MSWTPPEPPDDEQDESPDETAPEPHGPYTRDNPLTFLVPEPILLRLERVDGAGAAPGEQPVAFWRAGPDEVLLVEDEPRVRSQARRLLQRSGYEVIEASDGAEGRRVFAERQGEVKVVVTDVVMPMIGGVEMVSTLRAIQPQLPVVFVSGYTAEDQDLPLDDRTAFLTKPYTIDSLCDAIATVVPS